MMDELVASVARATRLSPEQSTLAVAAVLRFFTARLPSSLVGELHARLESPTRAATPRAGGAGAADAPESTP
jgi:hypothetical protein